MISRAPYFGNHAGHTVDLKLEKISPALRNLPESRSCFICLAVVFFIPFVRSSVSNFKQFIHERGQYVVTEELI